MICYYSHNKRDTRLNSFLAVRKKTSSINDITFSIRKLIDKTNKNTSIYFEINNELSDFNNDGLKQPVQRIGESDTRRKTSTDRQKERRTTRSNGRISKKPRLLS